jgi:glycosyltransferase involved in cell wall biosynthesis
MCGISKPHAAQLSQQFGRPLRYIHNGIPLLPRPEPVNEGYLLSLNRMAPYKGIMDCIDIALQTGHKIKLVGDDVHVESQDFVAQVIERCRQSNGMAEYYGAVDNETKWDLLSKCKAMIACPQIASFQEAFGLYAVEAGMFGKPIIALANGGLMDIIRHGENGLLGSTPTRLVELIDKLNDIKPENCRKIVEDEYSLEAMTRNYLAMATAVVQDESSARW